MRRLGNGVVSLGAAAALLAGGLYLFTGRAGPGSVLSLDRLVQEEQRNQELREEIAAVAQIMADKRELAQEVADGRLSLGDAAGRFRELDAGASHFNAEEFRRRFPGDSDDERYRRQVIHFAVTEAEQQPGRAAAVKERLAVELDDYLRHHAPGQLRASGDGRARPASE